MHFMKAITGACVLAACAAVVPSASAQTLQVLTAGSSAQFGPFAVGAYALARNGGATAYHYTVKSGACPTSTTSGCYAFLDDSRTVSSNTVPLEPGNLWVVWSTNGIWAYLSVDSIVGVRNFMAVPRATMGLGALASLPLSTTSNYLYWPDGTKDTALTSTVYAALNGKALTAANTDVRPEDALYATNRALNTLGYGKVADPRSGHSGQFLIGNPIISEFTSTAVANPVSFALAGDDPMSGSPAPTTYLTIPIGAAPIAFVASTASGSTTAGATNITSANAASLFSGTGNCVDTLVTGATGAINPIMREPISGTMNTTEFTVFQANGRGVAGSQENGVSATANNPLDKACGSGFRQRGVGTGDVVKAVIAHPNSLGYVFFSFETTGGGSTDKYITLNGIDPINKTYSTGTLPTCPTSSGYYNCPVAGGTSFPNLRNGTYPAWSIYRVVTDTSVTLPNGTKASTNVATLVAKAQALVNSQVPDFVPFTPVCSTSTTGTNDPGLAVYREHFVPSTIATIPNTITITPNDGSLGSTVTCTLKRASLPALTLGGGVEAGGDVGGTIQGPFTTSPTYPGPTESQPH